MADFRLFDPVGDAAAQGSTGIAGSGGFFSAGQFGANSTIGKGATTPYADGANSFAQGNNARVFGTNNFALGNNVYISGNNAFVHGNDINYPGLYNIAGGLWQGVSHNGGGKYNLIQGRDHTISASYSFAQGRDNEIESTATRAFVQGQNATARLDDQKVWGSSRTTGANGGAQSSRIIKHLQTTAASAATILTFPIESDMCYAITFSIVGAEGTADPPSGVSIVTASPYLGRGNVAATAASINAGTTSTTGTGTISGSTATIIASSANFLVQITPASANTTEWCADIQIVEVRAS